jgi:hypothetical protein
MTTRELFEFVTDPTINQSNMDSYLEKVRSSVPSFGSQWRAERERESAGCVLT